MDSCEFGSICFDRDAIVEFVCHCQQLRHLTSIFVSVQEGHAACALDINCNVVEGLDFLNRRQILVTLAPSSGHVIDVVSKVNVSAMIFPGCSRHTCDGCDVALVCVFLCDWCCSAMQIFVLRSIVRFTYILLFLALGWKMGANQAGDIHVIDQTITFRVLNLFAAS